MSYSLSQVTFFPPLFRDLFFKKYTYNKIMYLSEKYNWNRQKEFDNLIYIFSPMEIHTNKNFNKKLFTSFIIRKLHGTPCTIFQRYHPGHFMPLTMQNPCNFFLFLSFIKIILNSLKGNGHDCQPWAYSLIFRYDMLAMKCSWIKKTSIIYT